MAMMISSEAPQSGLANLMAMKGRYGDTELVHMSRPEVQGLASLGKITINPDTGLPEAWSASNIFKTIIPMAATAVGGFFGGPMGAAAGNALGQFAMGERDIGKIALQSMLTYGMGAMSASSGTAAAGATGSSTATTAGNATRAGMVGDGLNAGYNASQASLGSVSQVAPYVSPSSFGDGAIYSQSAGSPSGFNAYLSSDAIPYNPPSAVASALQAPTPQANLYNFEGSPGFAGTPFGKIEGGTNLTAAQTAKQGVTTIKTPDGNYISASDMKMDPTDYAKAHFSRPSTLIGGGLSAISNGVFEEEQPEYKENERIPYKPKNLKLISDPNTGKHRYIEITDEEAQQSRFAAEGGLIGLANGGDVSRVNTFLNQEHVQNTDPLGESLDGLQSLSSDMNIGSTSLMKPMPSMQPRTLNELQSLPSDMNIGSTSLLEPTAPTKPSTLNVKKFSGPFGRSFDKLVEQGILTVMPDGSKRKPSNLDVNNGGLTLEEFGDGKHRYTRNDPLVETVIESSAPSSVQGVPDDISDDDSADAGADAGGGGAAGDPGGEGGGEDGSEGAAWATGGLVGLTKSERKNVRHLADGGNLSIDGNDPDEKYESSSEYIEDMLEINTLEKLDNFDNFFRNLAIVESNNKNKPSSTKHNAAGFYQFMSNNGKDGKFTGSSLHGALNRLTKTYSRMNKKLPTRFKEIYKSKNVTKLGKEDQKELVMADFYERKGTDPILKNIADGDPESAFNLYRDIHLTSVGADQLAKRENSTRYKTVSELFKERMKPIVSDGLDDVDQDTTIENSTGGLASMKSNGPPHIEVPTFDNTKAYATGGGIGGYFEGQVDGRGNGMSDEIPFEVEGNDPDKALLSRDEYVIPADAVAMLGNGSSNGGAERLDGFIKQLREQSFGTQEQQQPIERQQGLSGLA